MLKPLICKFLGFVTSIYPLIGVIFSLFKYGWKKTFYVKERLLPPKTLTDPKWGTHQYVHLPGIKMHYVEKGDKDKPLMVFLHGFPEFWYSWRYQLQNFSSDYWCVAPDLRGYGDTDKPTGIDQYSLDTLATDINNLVRAMGRDKCILVGHDWGGAVGYHVCTLFPDLVSCYICCNLPHPSSFNDQLGGLDQTLKSWYIMYFQCPILPEMTNRMGDIYIFDAIAKDMKNPHDKEDIEAYKYTFRDRAAFTGPINYYRHIVQYSDISVKPPNTKVPVLSIFGTGDKYLSVAAAKGSRKYVDDYEEVMLEGMSHWVQIDAYKQVNEAMEKYLETRKW